MRILHVTHGSANSSRVCLGASVYTQLLLRNTGLLLSERIAINLVVVMLSKNLTDLQDWVAF